MNDLILSPLTEFQPVPIAAMQKQVNQVQELMKSVMIKDVHYGTIPNTTKPVLLKPGAEKLLMLFRLRPEFEVTTEHHEGGHRTITTKTLIKSGDVLVGMGMGSCSTLESKYRWREDKKETNTGISLPKAYWDTNKANPKAGQEMLSRMAGEKGFKGQPSARKVDGLWVIVMREGTGEKVENPDIADMYNTVLKMSIKRSLVGGTIFCLSVSDLFDQDIDESVYDYRQDQAVPKQQPQAQAQPTPQAAPRPQPQPQPQVQQSEVVYEDDIPPEWKAQAATVVTEEAEGDYIEIDMSGAPDDTFGGYPDVAQQARPTQEARKSDADAVRWYSIPYKIDGMPRESLTLATKAAGLRWNPERKLWHVTMPSDLPDFKTKVKDNLGELVEIDLSNWRTNG